MVPWLYAFAVFTVFRLFAFLFASIVNDLIFGYNISMCLLWSLFSIINVYGWVLNYSLYLELRNLSKIEDYAHLRVSFISLFLNLAAFTTFPILFKPLTMHLCSVLDGYHGFPQCVHSKLSCWLKTNNSTWNYFHISHSVNEITCCIIVGVKSLTQPRIITIPICN